MPLESKARIAAERLLILTEALSDAVLNERYEDIRSLLESRQNAIDQMTTLTIDAPAQAVLQQVKKAEADLTALMVRSRESATQELVQLFSGARQIRAYTRQKRSQGLLRAS
ncbi:MAG TPA: hypothetical protein VNI20_00555 [Fimbriimonadaceae bacterium]|nr:hypothetical protein [Fimbriimonadaceae bacterium]